MALFITPSGIPSTEAVGDQIVQGPPCAAGEICPRGIVSAEVVSSPSMPLSLIGSARGHLPPFRSLEGNFYAVTGDATNSLSISRSQGPHIDWVDISAGSPSAFPVIAWAVQEGDKIHIASTPAGATYTYHRFNMATDTWEIIDDLIATPPQAPDDPWVSIAVRAGDEPVVVYAGHNGAGFNRVSCRARVGGSWSGDLFSGVSELQSAVIDYFNPICVKSAVNDSVHVWVNFADVVSTVPDGAVLITVLSDNNVTNDSSSSPSSDVHINALQNGVSYVDSSDPNVFDAGNFNKIRFAGVGFIDTTDTGAAHLLEEKNSDQGRLIRSTTSLATFATNAESPKIVVKHGVLTLARDDTNNTLHILFANADDNGYIYHTLSINGGVAWSAPESIQEVNNVLSISANVFHREGKTVLAFVFDSNGDYTDYKEVTLTTQVIYYAGGIESDEEFGSPLITLDGELSLTGITSDEAFGSPNINAVQAITVTGITSAEAVGVSAVSKNLGFIVPTGITSGETFGLASLLYIGPAGLASAEAFGALSVFAATDITPTAIAGAEAFGTTVVADGGLAVRPTGIAGAEIFGASVTANVIPDALSGKGRITTTLFGDVAFIPIQATVPCTETLTWKTDTRISHDGTESRERLITAPRQTMKYRFSEGVANKALAYLTEYGGFGETWAVPLWTEALGIGAQASGKSSITFDTTQYDYRDNSLALLYESETNFEIIEINSVSVSSITLLVNTVNTYTDVSIMPVRLGIVSNPISKSNRGHAAIASIKYLITDNVALYELVPIEQFLGDDVYIDPPLVRDPSNGYRQEVFAKSNKADFGLGSFDHRTPWANSRSNRPAMAIHQGAEEIRLFKMFLERRGGKHQQYWEPSFEADLKSTGSGIVGTTLRVAQIGQQDWDEERTHIAIEDLQGNWSFRTITAFTVVGQDVDLTIENLNLDASGISTISYLGLKRFDTDDIVIKWVGNNTIISNIPTVEIAQ